MPSSTCPSSSNDEYPPVLRELKRVAFWQKHAEREIPVTMAAGSEIYLQTLLDLAEQIRKPLKKMREEQKAETASIVELAKCGVFGMAAVKLPAEGRKVFLAQVTDDLDEEREQVRRYLEQSGIAVLPESPYPQDGADFSKALEGDLGRSEAFVHLLGRYIHQAAARHAALATIACSPNRRRRAGLPILQWLRPDVDPAAITDPEHAKLLVGENVMRMGLEGSRRRW